MGISTHSTVASGRIESFFRMCDGTETCPRLETFVRMAATLQEGRGPYK